MNCANADPQLSSTSCLNIHIRDLSFFSALHKTVDHTCCPEAFISMLNLCHPECRTTLEECHQKTLGEVMDRVLNGDIPLDYGPWLYMSPEGVDLMRQLTHRQIPFLKAITKIYQHTHSDRRALA